MQRHLTGLKEVFNVSTVTVIEAEEPTDGISTSYGRKMSLKRFSEYEIGVSPATGHKCARCWNFMPEVSDYGIWQNVCTRCQGALTEMGIPPPQPEAAQ
jgi:isoleucyl-tRNA synthetase